MSSISQETLDKNNVEFWNTLCGTNLAKTLGITSNSASDLKKFDDWYFNFYPYLNTYIPFSEISKNDSTLEIGLGYGTVAQKLMKTGTHYHGLDISHGPVNMVQHRAKLINTADTNIQQGSALAIPFNNNTFDYVISIGCLHHTGNLQLALHEVLRVLKPGGTAVIMLYNALSYRHWLNSPRDTCARLIRNRSYNKHTDSNLITAEWDTADEVMRHKYDADDNENAAPYTTFVTQSEIKHFFSSKVSSLKIHTTNIGDESFLQRIPRETKLRLFGAWLGLDHYIKLTK